MSKLLFSLWIIWGTPCLLDLPPMCLEWFKRRQKQALYDARGRAEHHFRKLKKQAF
jgi:hypothetical protein